MNEVDDQTRKTLTYSGAKYGALAGFIATWFISAAMVAAELILGLQISLFYYVVGSSLGLNDPTYATYLGFSLHILVGTILGAVVGIIIFRWRKRVMIQMRGRRTLIGIGAGIVIWFIFFLPITTLIIEPTLHSVASLSSESQKRILNDLNPFIRNVVVSAIGFHIVWGAIVGFFSVKIYEMLNKTKQRSVNL